MDIKEYIESGLLEAYVLGALTPEEHARVQADIARHAELAEEVRALERTMQQYANTYAKEPPAAMQGKIWNAIQQSATTAKSAGEGAQPPKTIPLPPPEVHKPAVWKYAAIWAALLGSMILNMMLYSQIRVARSERVAMNTRITELQASQQKMAALEGQYRKASDMMADTAMQTIVMHTMQKGHPMAAMVYWNKNHGDTYVAMNALPHPPTGKQYQMWVIQNGKPKSMGVLPNEMASTLSMQKMDMSITGGDAFAISLENEGGSPSPTEVYVMGRI